MGGAMGLNLKKCEKIKNKIKNEWAGPETENDFG